LPLVGRREAGLIPVRPDTRISTRSQRVAVRRATVIRRAIRLLQTKHGGSRFGDAADYASHSRQTADSRSAAKTMTKMMISSSETC
jgi:hypothetical protein